VHATATGQIAGVNDRAQPCGQAHGEAIPVS
jgi:hypothetical protein